MSLLPDRFCREAAFDPSRRALAMIDAVCETHPRFERRRSIRMYLLSAVFGMPEAEFERRFGVKHKHVARYIERGRKEVEWMVREDLLKMDEWRAFVATRCTAPTKAKEGRSDAW